MAEKEGMHRESGKHRKVTPWPNRRHHLYWVCGHALYEIGIGGAAIVVFERARPIWDNPSHVAALAEIVRNVQF